MTNSSILRAAIGAMAVGLVGAAPVDRPGIHSVAFDTHGRLAAGDDRGTVRLWDVAAGRSHEGKLLLVGGEGGRLSLHRLSPPAPRKDLAGHGADILAIAFSGDGYRVATAASDGSILLWNTDDWEPIRLEGHVGAVRDLAFSKDGGRLASAGSDGTTRVWSAGDGAPVVVLDPSEAPSESASAP
jgi:WD40 repeat protein